MKAYLSMMLRPPADVHSPTCTTQQYFVKFIIFLAPAHLLHLLCLEFEEVQLEVDPAALLELDGPGEAAEADPGQVVVQRRALLPRQLVIAGQVPGTQQIFVVLESWNFATKLGLD